MSLRSALLSAAVVTTSLLVGATPLFAKATFMGGEDKLVTITQSAEEKASNTPFKGDLFAGGRTVSLETPITGEAWPAGTEVVHRVAP